MTVWSIVLAAGSGDRFGAAKQFALLDGRRLVDHSIEAARATTDGVVVVVPPGHEWTGDPAIVAVAGGADHQASVGAGLAAVPPAAHTVVVATAAHPLASPRLYRAVVAAVRDGADASAPVVSSADALKRVDDARVTASVDKSDVVIVQAPAAFRRATLEAALRSGTAPEELELVERTGGLVVTVPGEATNLHVATPLDLRMAEALLPVASTL